MTKEQFEKLELSWRKYSMDLRQEFQRVNATEDKRGIVDAMCTWRAAEKATELLQSLRPFLVKE